MTMTQSSINEKSSYHMLYCAMFVLFLLTQTTTALVCDTTEKFVATKPLCYGQGKCCTEGVTVNTGGISGQISDGSGSYERNIRCTWIIGPFPEIKFKFTSFETKKNYDYVLLQGCDDALCLNTPLTSIGDFSGSSSFTYYSNEIKGYPSTTTQYTTSRGYMRIFFRSDINPESTQFAGFVGTWSVTSTGYPVCAVCPPNQLVQDPNSGQTEISSCTCKPGWTTSASFSESWSWSFPQNWNAWCQPCPSGTYEASRDECRQCPQKSTSVQGSSLCTCDAGYEATGLGVTSCSACTSGKYRTLDEPICVACQEGTFSNVNGSSACKRCEVGSTSSLDRRTCNTCPDGTQAISTGGCEDCQIGYFSNAETNRRCIKCPSGFYSTAPRSKECTPCRACPDGYYRKNCVFAGGGGTCVPCLTCGDGLVNVGCMNRAGHSDEAGTCRSRTYVSRTPLCDESDSGIGLGGYPFLTLFGVSQDDASFQCRRRCDNTQNILSSTVYTDNQTYIELLSQFPKINSKPRAFDGGKCGGPYACNVANCNIVGSSDDSQPNYQPKLACPVYIEPAMDRAFWAAINTPSGADSSVVQSVNSMRSASCQTCASCGSGGGSTPDWGRGCARDCTQLSCQPGFIFDWTEPVQTAKCKTCGDLDDVRLCLSSEQAIFEGYDVSGRFPKIFMRQCRPKRQMPMRGYEIGYGNCVNCADFADACVAQRDTYYHTCEETSVGILTTCRSCSRSNGRVPSTSRFWDGIAYQHLYCQQQACTVSAGLSYTGVSTESVPHRICHDVCKPIVCEGGAAQVILPCILPHQRRCKDAINMDSFVNDAEYRPITYTPAHTNILEQNTTQPHLFSNFENILIDHDAPTLSLRAQCVWNADFILDNNVNPAGISSRFQSDCRAWTRNARVQYPLMPLQNTVAQDALDSSVFPRRLLLNTSATAVAYTLGSITRPDGVFTGDVFLLLDMTKTNNATLAAFVPDDRGIEEATWIPRWRASVQAKQIAGDNTNVSLVLVQEQTCFACYSLRIFPEPNSDWTTTNMKAAIDAFNGGKFIFLPSADLLVCEKSVQARAYPVFLETRYDANLSVIFASSLTETCVSKFGIRVQELSLPTDLVRSSHVVASGECIVFLFSSARVYCMRRAGSMLEMSWKTAVLGTIVDVVVHDGFIVRTLYSGVFGPGNSANYISLLSNTGNTSESVLQVAGLIMFARGAPRYFVRRNTAASLSISKFETQNDIFRLNASATYATNDVKILFSRFVPVSAKNTLLEYADDFLVFATAKYSGNRVIVYFTALDTTLASSNTYSMPFGVFVITSTDPPEKINDAYESIDYAGEALLSCTWFEKRVLLVSVSVDGTTPGQFMPLLVNVTDLTIVTKNLHPDLTRVFDAPFVRAANAILSAGKILSCSECTPASVSSSSGFFAYGVSNISYRKLMPCDEANSYVEENAARNIPVKTCTKVRYDSGNVYSITMQLTLKCVKSMPLEVILDVPANYNIAFGKGIRYIPKESTRLLLSVSCLNKQPLSVIAYNNAECELGCFFELWTGGHLQIQGGITIESIRHRPTLSLTSERWDRRTLLQIGTPRATYSSARITSEWKEYSITARGIVHQQQIDVRMQRDVSVVWLAAFQDNEQRIALDALMLVPVLSEHFMPVVVLNTSFLASIVYVPTVTELRIVALETLAYGDDMLDWARVHASVHISNVTPDLRQCAYVARVIAVDNNLQMLGSTKTVTTGCLLDLARSAQCHIELPVKLANTEGIVGLALSPVNSACRSLSDADDISVEFAPFMRISQCPVFSFMRTDTLTCTSCDIGGAICSPGKYVRGCRSLIHPSITPECINCTVPNNSAFPDTSRGCDTWACLKGFYRRDASCMPCTSLLTTVCRATGGLKHQNCTSVENEKCIECGPKPRYSDWVVTSDECTWRCKPGFFETGGGCEVCQSFTQTVAVLAVTGTRVAGAFYRFQACSKTAQARAEICSENDFGFSLNGAYVADGRAFGEDCVLKYTENSNLHSVAVNVTRAGVTWTVKQYVACSEADWPVFVNSSRLPRYAFEMSAACVVTCVRSAGFFAHMNRSRTCLYCPVDACNTGFFYSAKDNCAVCQPCTAAVAGGIFTARGTFDDPRSCPETCPSGYFMADSNTCRPHSVLSCRSGLQYAIAGTQSEDARCGTCADCSGAKEVVPCTVTSNRQCTSCGPIDVWSSTWSRSGCQLECRTDLGYTKLYTQDGEICRKCIPCPLGHALPSRPSNCTCQPCSVNIPPTAVYTKGCEWTCPLYYVARLDTSGALVCQYTIRQTSSVVNHLRSVSPVTCPAGQHLVPDPRQAAYATFVCENCSTPSGMRIQDLNITWMWDRSCAWQCAWGFDKQFIRGYFACETFSYTHKLKNKTTVAAPVTGVFMTQIIGIVVGAVVFVVFGMCFLCKMVGG